ncbi:MAG TPA: dihydrodipicolinate synthase family protein [Victivallales bacterium]|nr:dihydrodipicolinate synthase family protein [Victivallales bacterium]
MTQLLKGIIPPMVTPLLERGKLDCEGLEKLIEHIIKGGVHGLFILGTTGEAPSLSYNIRNELVERTCKIVKNRVPVVVGIADTIFDESVKLAHKAEKCGAHSVVLTQPYYFPAGQEELKEYYFDILNEINLPLYLYNIPSNTKIKLEPDTVASIAEHPLVHGLKDSSGDMTYFHYVKKALKGHDNFSMLVGYEQLICEALMMGADGGVHGGANFYPELYVKLYEASLVKDYDKMRKLHEEIIDVCLSIYGVGRYGSSLIKGIKCALSLLGLCSDATAEPFHAFKEPEQMKVKENLIKLGLLQK